MAKKIFIISGEESGDLHGSALLAELKRIVPDLEIKGMGGKRMREAGLRGLDSARVSVVGIAEVIEKSPQILRSLSSLKALLRRERFDVAVFIDFPDFNLKLAREAKRLGIPVVYYISPQVWAWRKGRIKRIAALVDRMLVVFPFEKDLYRREGVDVEYVGHPLADMVRCDLSPPEAKRLFGLSAPVVVSLLPGSRTSEVRRHLPLMLDAAAIIERQLDEDVEFLVPRARGLNKGLLESLVKGRKIRVHIVDRMYEALRASGAAVVCSGTATLETALIGTPMVIVYRMSRLSYAVGRALVDVDFIGLPNIVAGRKVAAELIQDEATPGRIASETLKLIRDFKKRNDIMKSLEEIRTRLEGGAASRAARAVAAVMGARARQ